MVVDCLFILLVLFLDMSNTIKSFSASRRSLKSPGRTQKVCLFIFVVWYRGLLICENRLNVSKLFSRSFQSVHTLSNEELRASLIALGANVGPITTTTRITYEKQLEKRLKNSKSSEYLNYSSDDLTNVSNTYVVSRRPVFSENAELFITFSIIKVEKFRHLLVRPWFLARHFHILLLPPLTYQDLEADITFWNQPIRPQIVCFSNDILITLWFSIFSRFFGFLKILKLITLKDWVNLTTFPKFHWNPQLLLFSDRGARRVDFKNSREELSISKRRIVDDCDSDSDDDHMESSRIVTPSPSLMSDAQKSFSLSSALRKYLNLMRLSFIRVFSKVCFDLDVGSLHEEVKICVGVVGIYNFHFFII